MRCDCMRWQHCSSTSREIDIIFWLIHSFIQSQGKIVFKVHATHKHTKIDIRTRGHMLLFNGIVMDDPRMEEKREGVRGRVSNCVCGDPMCACPLLSLFSPSLSLWQEVFLGSFFYYASRGEMELGAFALHSPRSTLTLFFPLLLLSNIIRLLIDRPFFPFLFQPSAVAHSSRKLW